MQLDTTFLERCIKALDEAHTYLLQKSPDDSMHDILRAACVKEFELVLEQSGSLLRKRLADYFSSNREAEELVFKDVFRHAAKRSLLEADTCERWLEYRDHRNKTAHDYGKRFADETLELLPQFIKDARELAACLKASRHD